MTAVLHVLILGEPTPSQMGAVFRDGRAARKPDRVRSYQKMVGLLTRLAVCKANWTSSADESFIVTARFFVGDARVVDGDNLFKCLADGLKRVAFPDDRQICEGHWYKSVDRDKPRTEVEIARVTT